MIELVACIGMFLGLCGQIHTATFETEKQCYAALAEIRKAPNLKYAYCRPPQKKAREETK